MTFLYATDNKFRSSTESCSFAPVFEATSDMYSIISSYLRLFWSSRARGKREIGLVVSRRKKKATHQGFSSLSFSVGGLFGRKREKNETTRAEKPPRSGVHGTPTAKTNPPACGDRRLARDSSRLRPAFISRVSQSPRIATLKIFPTRQKLVDYTSSSSASSPKKIRKPPPNAPTRPTPYLSACSANFALNTRSSRSIFFPLESITPSRSWYVFAEEESLVLQRRRRSSRSFVWGSFKQIGDFRSFFSLSSGSKKQKKGRKKKGKKKGKKFFEKFSFRVGKKFEKKSKNKKKLESIFKNRPLSSS